MAKTVTIDQMAEEIARTLSEWSQDVSDSMKEAGFKPNRNGYLLLSQNYNFTFRLTSNSYISLRMRRVSYAMGFEFWIQTRFTQSKGGFGCQRLSPEFVLTRHLR